MTSSAATVIRAGCGAMALLAATARTAAAHPGEPPRPHDVWTGWTWDPWIWLPLAALAISYALGERRVWKSAGRMSRVRKRAMWFFCSGMATLVLALLSPVHELSEALFSVHMAQHELLMLVAAPLLVLAAPDRALLWALPGRVRPVVVRRLRDYGVTAAWTRMTQPLVAWLLHATAIWAWHIPALFDATLASAGVHALQHATFFGSALVFWWSLVRGAQRRARGLAAVLSLFTTALHTTVLGVLLTVASEPWYVTYGESVAAFGMAPLEDQQLGGLIMWVPGGMIYALAALFFLPALLRQQRTAAPVLTRSSAVALALVVMFAGACREHTPEADARGLTGGDPRAGAREIRRYGCASCHVIAGISGAVGQVGPPLTGIANRHFIAGVLPNTPDNMVRWIEDPPKVDSLTAMPKLGVSREAARDIAAYLYTLR